MYDHVDAGATHPLSLEHELLSFTGPNRAISVAVYSDFHTEVSSCLRLSSDSDVITQRSIARFKQNGSVRRAAELRWLDYAAGVDGPRFSTEEGRGPAAERSHFVGIVMQQVGSQAVVILMRLWDESQPLVWASISQGCSSSIDVAFGQAVFDEALALEQTVVRIRAQRGSFMCRGRLCDASCIDSHFNVTCARCGQDWGNHVGHTCQGSAQVEDSYVSHVISAQASTACA
jgi:hypothetical protein